MFYGLMLTSILLTVACIGFTYSSERADHHEESKLSALAVSAAIPAMCWVVGIAIMLLSVLL